MTKVPYNSEILHKNKHPESTKKRLGTGMWYKLIPEINQPVMSIDLPGFGDSERLVFGEDPISEWILALKIVISSEISGNYVWGAHSLGAYLMMNCILREDKIKTLFEDPVNELFLDLVNEYDPNQLKGIILLDPWEREHFIFHDPKNSTFGEMFQNYHTFLNFFWKKVWQFGVMDCRHRFLD